MTTSHFDDFWEHSSLDRHTLEGFARRMNAYDADGREQALDYPRAAVPLPSVRGPLNRLTARRRSTRTFTNRPVTVALLAQALSGLHRSGESGSRGYASAGAAYTTEVFAVGFDSSPWPGTVQYFDPLTPGLTLVHDHAPSWAQATDAINAGVDGTPALMLVGTMFTDRATAKYGERGARFATLEAGAVMHALSLGIAQSRHLGGVVVGGLLDRYWIEALRLPQHRAKIAFGLLLGRR